MVQGLQDIQAGLSCASSADRSGFFIQDGEERNARAEVGWSCKSAIEVLEAQSKKTRYDEGTRSRSPLDGELSGLAYVRDGVPIIGVNTLHAPARQRFTLAHELAHIQLHRAELDGAVHVDRGSLRRDGLASAGTDPTEIEANTFAAELLMPTDLLMAALGGHSVDLEDDEAVASLAQRFRVSEAAMRYRLSSLGESG